MVISSSTELQNTPPDKKLQLLKQNSMESQRYANIYEQAVQGERTALAMDYMDLNKAIARIVRDGYEVSEPEIED